MISPVRFVWIFCFISFTVLSCAQENKRVLDGTNISEEDMDALIESEMANADRAKNGKDYDVLVIDNEETVSATKAVLLKRIEEKHKEQAKNKNALTLSEQYLSGNSSVLPQIISTLNSGSTKEKEQMLRDLSLSNYTLRENVELKDPSLAKAILNCIDDPATEKEAIQVAGFFKVPGYVSKFESRLLSGRSKDVERLVFWLGSDGTSIKALDHIIALLANDKVPGDTYWIMSGLSSYAEKNDPAINAKLRALAEKYLAKNGMKADRSEDMLRLLFEVPASSSLVWINKAIENRIGLSDALAALVKVQGEKSRATVLKYVDDPEVFNSSWEAVEELGKIKKDEELEKHFLTGYQKKEKEHSFSSVMRVLAKIHPANEPLTSVNALSDKKLAGKIKRHYEISKLSLREIADDMYDKKLISTRISNEALTKAEKNADEYTSNVESVLNLSNIHFWFDAETGSLPVDYDSLLWQFAGISNGILKDMIVWMDASTNDDYEHVDYKITVVFNNKVYIIQPEDIGDWYEITSVEGLLNKMLEDAGRPERFVSIDTGDQTARYLFGNENVVKEFKEKYLLE